jgi:hypothetical protein
MASSTSQPILQTGPVAIYELLGAGDPVRLESLLAIYMEQFPQYAHYAPRIRRRASYPADHDPRFVLHYWLVEVDGLPAGIRLFRYVRSRRCGLANALAVIPHFRYVRVNEERLSEFIIHACLKQVIADAQACYDLPVYGMVNEVDAPQLMAHYRRMGIRELPVQYMEPVFAPADDRAPADPPLIVPHPMTLGFLPAPGGDHAADDREIIGDFVRAFLIDHYGLPEDHALVRQAIRSISLPD